MKHVFIINSHTTFLTAMGTVEYLKLKDEDVIFIYTRNYSNEITHVPFKVVEGTAITDASKNIGKDYEGYIRKVDDFIDQNIKGKYSLFVPHFQNYCFQILYTHKRCRKASYIQEGGPAVIKMYENDVPIIERTKSFIRHAILRRRTFECKWYKKGTLYKQHTLDSYAINNVYFHSLPSHNHIVKWPVEKLNIKITADYPIFIFDGHVSNGFVEPNIYIQLCKEIISLYAKGKNYVKFHPAQSREERNSIIGSFSEKGYSIEVMSDDIPVEYVIIQFKKLTFVGFTSSLLYYAHDYGHNVCCCEKLLLENSQAYKKRVDESGIQLFSEMYGCY